MSQVMGGPVYPVVNLIPTETNASNRSMRFADAHIDTSGGSQQAHEEALPGYRILYLQITQDIQRKRMRELLTGLAMAESTE